MYLFNGWIVLRNVTCKINDEVISAFKRYIDFINKEEMFILRRNGLDSFLISGVYNHKKDYIVDIYKWVAKNLPESYGLLHIWDDEYNASSNSIEFLVWKISKGELVQVKDPFFQSFIPTI